MSQCLTPPHTSPLTQVRYFFREIVYSGAGRIPTDKPTILVCGPHANQFLDPLIVLGACRRETRFVMAAKSMRRPMIGFLASPLSPIAVERPQDVVRTGDGLVQVKGKTCLAQGGADFVAQGIQAKDTLKIGDETRRVEAVVDSTTLMLDRELPPGGAPSAYKIQPHLDHHTMYAEVERQLLANGCVGIFPEGGSHDRSSLLPLKAGVAIMALSAQARGKRPVALVPCGLNYFSGFRFRGRCLMEVGEPIYASQELVDMFLEGGDRKREACNRLMAQIQEALGAVTEQSEDWNTCRLLWTARRLYAPTGRALTLQETTELTRRFLRFYEKHKDEPRVASMRAATEQYIDTLNHLGLADRHVKHMTTPMSRGQLLRRLGLLVLAVLWKALVMGPLLLAALPVLLAARIVAFRKARSALAASSVKLTGRDVLATWKVLSCAVLLPICLVVYSLAAGWLYGRDVAVIVFWGLPLAWHFLLPKFDELRAEMAAIPPLARRLLGRHPRSIIEMRCDLVADIRAVVTALVPPEERMFQSHDLE